MRGSPRNFAVIGCLEGTIRQERGSQGRICRSFVSLVTYRMSFSRGRFTANDIIVSYAPRVLYELKIKISRLCVGSVLYMEYFSYESRSLVFVCCVFSSHLFWTSSSLDVPAGVTQKEGHTGFLIHLPSAVCVCVCLCVFFPFILDIKFVGRTSRGHTGGRSHRISHPPSFCGACLNFSREKDSAIPFPRRP